MATLVMNGLGEPYDGEHEIPTKWKNRELHRIKQISGVPAGLLNQAAEDGDIGVLVALATAVLEREGLRVNLELLWDANEDNFDIIPDAEEEGDAGRPPDTPTAGGQPSENDADESGNESSPSSGTPGSTDGDDNQPSLSHIGNHGSETSADSGPATLVS